MEKLEAIAKLQRLNLIANIQDISDREYQHEVWVEAKRPGVVDSWEETMCSIFDDIDLEWMFALENREMHGYTVEQRETLIRFLEKLEKYSNETPQFMVPKEVISDPDWQAIVDEAQEVIKLFPEVKDLDRLMVEAIENIPEDD